jgi:hypothetical protein
MASLNGVVTTAGKQLKARLLRNEPLPGLGWYAVGAGIWSDKDNPPNEDLAATGLTNEIARRQITRSAFLQADVLGTLSYNGLLYKEVAGPTAIVAYFADFTELEIPGAVICEEGIFGGQVDTTSTPFVLAAGVLAPGVLYWVRNRRQATKEARDTIGVVAIFEEK